MQDLTGQGFGRLTVVSLDHKEQSYLSNGIKNGFRTYYLCKCDCGNTKVILSSSLVNGNTKSCGCACTERIKELGKKSKTHGKTKTRIYKIWLKIKERCYNPNAIRFKRYGGRGINVCDEWKNDFQTFYDWSMANGYSDQLSIDRINNNGNYEQSNCRWVNVKVQNRNRTTNKIITYNNQSRCVSEWAEILHIPESKLRQRIEKLHWSIERAFNTP